MKLKLNELHYLIMDSMSSTDKEFLVYWANCMVSIESKLLGDV